MATDKKDTIYVDIDDEITAVIDKVTSSSGKIVALVLPKRASVFQSQVNMKLLKRAADDAKKHIVLVTSESGLLPLAGAAGLYVAKTPTSKPEVPANPDDAGVIEDVDEPETADEDFDSKTEANKPLGELAGLAVAGASEDDTIELDNSSTTKLASTDKKKVKPAKDKSKKIPNFGKFRNRGFLVVLALVLLGVLAYFAFAVWPHATISIYTKQTPLNADFVAHLDIGAGKVDPSNNIMPTVAETQQKSYSQTVPATGQKDEGNKATGSVVMTICATDPSQIQTVPAGTGVSTNNLTFITQNDASFLPSGFGSGCFKYQSNSVNIVAQNAGENYNVSDASFTVSGFQNVSASGTASGGTSNVVRVVQDSDIQSAKQKLKSQDEGSIKQTLQSQLQQNHLTVLPQTFTALPSDTEASAKSGDQANNVTVTENVTYVMFGYKADDLQQLVEANLAGQFDSSKQSILDYGLNVATFKLDGKVSSTKVGLQIAATVKVGPKFNVDDLKKQFAGKRAGDIRSEIGSHNGVSKVEVDLSPFWVSSVPDNTNKITIKFVKSND